MCTAGASLILGFAQVGDSTPDHSGTLFAATNDNFTLYRITLKNSPNFHVSYSSGNGFTVWGVKIQAPKRARKTDGIDPGNSTNVTIYIGQQLRGALGAAVSLAGLLSGPFVAVIAGAGRACPQLGQL